MKILLLGEYSNVHWTLGEGLKALGHDVTVVSDGDVWKGYQRDINLRRRSLGKWDTLKYLWDIKRLWPRLKGYDVVQIINPMFLDLMAERILPYYEQLRRQNGKMVMGAYGIDYYWVSEGMKSDTFRYSDFYLNGVLRHNHDNDVMIADWLKGAKGTLNRQIAHGCDAIVTGLYEYDVCYRPNFPSKTTFIPFPIHCDYIPTPKPGNGKIRFFIGIQKTRHEYKGTDIMLSALCKLEAQYPDRMEIVKAESVPFEQYKEMINSSHVLLDQLYSYTPGMNGLLAMSKGIVLVGGGEEEQYDIIHEHTLRPIINVQPNEQDVIRQIENRILLHPDSINQLAFDSIEYVRRHHDYIKVAKQYESLYQSL
ncbi:MAG: glycosyltransferase family 1 protein [Bacteroidaceae bacterium]|nr:glycosyltransferase family 1 protein [Bacteroidaceae bacterium]